jgi:mRNA interferase RelE/StbE
VGSNPTLSAILYLLISPHQYGEPLRKTLKEYWKLRDGDYRVVCKVDGNEICIFAIINQRDVYIKIIKRI